MLTHVFLLAMEDQHGQTLGACVTEKGILEAAEKVRQSYKGTWARDRWAILSMPEPLPSWINAEVKVALKVLRFPIREDIIDMLADLTRKT